MWWWLSFVFSLKLVKEGLPTRKKTTKFLFWIISIYSVSNSTMLRALREKEMATHSRILAQKIPRTEEPDRLQSMRSQRIGHD